MRGGAWATKQSKQTRTNKRTAQAHKHTNKTKQQNNEAIKESMAQ